MAKKIILACHVLGDGTGDIQHLIDFYSFLSTNEQTKANEYVLVVTYEYKELEQVFEQKLKELKIRPAHIFLSLRDDHENNFLANIEFIEQLQTADEIIRISSDSYLFHKNSPFYQYIKPEVTYKYLGEHERFDTYDGIPQCTSLGLGANCYGIKINPMDKISFEQAFAIFEENDPEFASVLISKTNTASANAFTDTHQLTPAYFNNALSLYRFLLLLSINSSITNGKDQVLFSSGRALNALLQNDLFNESFLKNSHIKEVRIIYRGSEEKSKQFSVNPNGKHTIYIFHGYKVSDASYQAIYQQTFISGVSGDNSLEMALSTNTIPYYHSTNVSAKKDTLEALAKIIEQHIVLPEKIKQYFILFFTKLPEWNSILARRNSQKEALSAIAETFSSLNYPEMLKYWPLVIAHLDKYYNFYKKLPAIINDAEKLSNEQTFEQISLQQTIGPKQSESQFSFFNQNAEDEVTLEDSTKLLNGQGKK